MKSCFPMVLAILEQRAQQAEREAKKCIENRKTVAALIEEVVAAEMRGMASQVEAAWKQERERNNVSS